MSTKLVNKSEVKNALKVKGVAGNMLAGIVMHVLGLHKINDIYDHVKDYEGVELADKVIEHLNVNVDYIQEELENIPKDQPFIVVSNHPFGGIDGIVMISLLGKIRPDLKILTNFILSMIPNLQNHFFPVNPFTDRPGMRSSLKGLKMAKEHLASGGALGLFPSGEVSSNQNKEKVVKDIDWQPSIIKLIKGAGVPVVPIYFHGENSRLFHFMGHVNPYLRTARLPHELINKRDKTIQVRIGKAILPSEFAEFENLNDMGKYLWNRTYALESGIVQENEAVNEPVASDVEPVAESLPHEKLCADMESISQAKLFTVGNYECYMAAPQQIPSMLQEIGRSREITFRAVGEGTNKSLDLDNYDTYYRHLILWDKEKKALVGAYRLGLGDEIMEQYGIKGFYSDTLFAYKNEFGEYLKDSIELGRSFVAPEYQKDPLALMLLIKGLMYVLMERPKVRYFIGPVSISAWYPMFYRSLMVYYLREKQSVPGLDKYVDPKNPFVPEYHKVDVEALLGSKIDTLERFDRFLMRMSNGNFRLPTLLKKYIKINARILAFNVDPDFNNCVDGLIMLDVLQIPKSEIDALSKEFEDKEAVYSRFGLN